MDYKNELDKAFQHSTVFKGTKMSRKDFLDYVIDHVDDWYLKGRVKFCEDNVFGINVSYEYFYLKCVGRSAKYRLCDAECDYLARQHKFFFDRLHEGGFEIDNTPVFSAAGTPISGDISLVEFSR